MLKKLRSLLPTFRIVRTQAGTFTLCKLFFIHYEAVFLRSGIMFAQFGSEKKNFFAYVPSKSRVPTFLLSTAVETVIHRKELRLGLLRRPMKLQMLLEEFDAKVR